MSTLVTAHRLAQLTAEMTPRDREIVAMLARLKLATGDQLLRVHWPDVTAADRRAARRALERLTRWRVLARLERRLGGLGRGSSSWTYALDVAGQKLLAAGGSARRPHLPRPAMWQHALTTSEAYTRLVEALRGTEMTLSEWQGEPESWRRFAGPFAEAVVLKPDAFVRLDGPEFSDLYFLEIDTGSQSRTVIARKCEAYRRYAAAGTEQAQEGVFPQVVFLTTTAARVELLGDLVRSLSPDVRRLFAVGLVCQTGDLLASSEVTS